MATKNFVRVSAEATEAAKFQGFIGNAQLSLTHLFRGINTFCFSFCPSDACGPLAIVPARRGQLFIQNEEAGGGTQIRHWVMTEAGQWSRAADEASLHSTWGRLFLLRRISRPAPSDSLTNRVRVHWILPKELRRAECWEAGAPHHHHPLLAPGVPHCSWFDKIKPVGDYTPPRPAPNSDWALNHLVAVWYRS